MPPFDTTKLATRAQSLVKRLPVTVAIGGKNRIGTRSNLNQERAWQLYGAQESVAESVSFAVADMAGVNFAELNKLTVDGKELRFLGYEYDAARVFVRIDLKAVNA